MRRKLITKTVLSCRHLRCRTSAWDLASAPWRPPDFFSGDQWISDKKYLKILGSQSHPCHVLFWWKTPLQTHLMYNPGYFTQSQIYVVWFYDTFINMEGIRFILCSYVCVYIYIYIWVNYNISLTRIKAILGRFPLLTIYIYIYIGRYVFSRIQWALPALHFCCQSNWACCKRFRWKGDLGPVCGTSFEAIAMWQPCGICGIWAWGCFLKTSRQ